MGKLVASMGHNVVRGSTKSEAGYLLPGEDLVSWPGGVRLGMGVCEDKVRAGVVVSQAAALVGDWAVRGGQGLPSEVAYE